MNASQGDVGAHLNKISSIRIERATLDLQSIFTKVYSNCVSRDELFSSIIGLYKDECDKYQSYDGIDFLSLDTFIAITMQFIRSHGFSMPESEVTTVATSLAIPVRELKRSQQASKYMNVGPLDVEYMVDAARFASVLAFGDVPYFPFSFSNSKLDEKPADSVIASMVPAFFPSKGMFLSWFEEQSARNRPVYYRIATSTRFPLLYYSSFSSPLVHTVLSLRYLFASQCSLHPSPKRYALGVWSILRTIRQTLTLFRSLTSTEVQMESSHIVQIFEQVYRASENQSAMREIGVISPKARRRSAVSNSTSTPTSTRPKVVKTKSAGLRDSRDIGPSDTRDNCDTTVEGPDAYFADQDKGIEAHRRMHTQNVHSAMDQSSFQGQGKAENQEDTDMYNLVCEALLRIAASTADVLENSTLCFILESFLIAFQFPMGSLHGPHNLERCASSESLSSGLMLAPVFNRPRLLHPPISPETTGSSSQIGQRPEDYLSPIVTSFTSSTESEHVELPFPYISSSSLLQYAQVATGITNWQAPLNIVSAIDVLIVCLDCIGTLLRDPTLRIVPSNISFEQNIGTMAGLSSTVKHLSGSLPNTNTSHPPRIPHTPLASHTSSGPLTSTSTSTTATSANPTPRTSSIRSITPTAATPTAPNPTPTPIHVYTSPLHARRAPIPVPPSPSLDIGPPPSPAKRRTSLTGPRAPLPHGRLATPCAAASDRGMPSAARSIRSSSTPAKTPAKTPTATTAAADETPSTRTASAALRRSVSFADTSLASTTGEEPSNASNISLLSPFQNARSTHAANAEQSPNHQYQPSSSNSPIDPEPRLLSPELQLSTDTSWSGNDLTVSVTTDLSTSQRSSTPPVPPYAKSNRLHHRRPKFKPKKPLQLREQILLNLSRDLLVGADTSSDASSNDSFEVPSFRAFESTQLPPHLANFNEQEGSNDQRIVETGDTLLLSSPKLGQKGPLSTPVAGNKNDGLEDEELKSESQGLPRGIDDATSSDYKPQSGQVEERTIPVLDHPSGGQDHPAVGSTTELSSVPKKDDNAAKQAVAVDSQPESTTPNISSLYVPPLSPEPLFSAPEPEAQPFVDEADVIPALLSPLLKTTIAQNTSVTKEEISHLQKKSFQDAETPTITTTTTPTATTQALAPVTPRATVSSTASQSVPASAPNALASALHEVASQASESLLALPHESYSPTQPGTVQEVVSILRRLEVLLLQALSDTPHPDSQLPVAQTVSAALPAPVPQQHPLLPPRETAPASVPAPLPVAPPVQSIAPRTTPEEDAGDKALETVSALVSVKDASVVVEPQSGEWGVPKGTGRDQLQRREQGNSSKGEMSPERTKSALFSQSMLSAPNRTNDQVALSASFGTLVRSYGTEKSSTEPAVYTLTPETAGVLNESIVDMLSSLVQPGANVHVIRGEDLPSMKKPIMASAQKQAPTPVPQGTNVYLASSETPDPISTLLRTYASPNMLSNIVSPHLHTQTGVPGLQMQTLSDAYRSSSLSQSLTNPLSATPVQTQVGLYGSSPILNTLHSLLSIARDRDVSPDDLTAVLAHYEANGQLAGDYNEQDAARQPGLTHFALTPGTSTRASSAVLRASEVELGSARDTSTPSQLENVLPTNDASAAPVVRIEQSAIAITAEALRLYKATGDWVCSYCYYPLQEPYSLQCKLCRGANPYVEHIASENAATLTESLVQSDDSVHISMRATQKFPFATMGSQIQNVGESELSKGEVLRLQQDLQELTAAYVPVHNLSAGTRKATATVPSSRNPTSTSFIAASPSASQLTAGPSPEKSHLHFGSPSAAEQSFLDALSSSDPVFASRSSAAKPLMPLLPQKTYTIQCKICDYVNIITTGLGSISSKSTQTKNGSDTSREDLVGCFECRMCSSQLIVPELHSSPIDAHKELSDIDTSAIYSIRKASPTSDMHHGSNVSATGKLVRYYTHPDTTVPLQSLHPHGTTAQQPGSPLSSLRTQTDFQNCNTENRDSFLSHDIQSTFPIPSASTIVFPTMSEATTFPVPAGTSPSISSTSTVSSVTPMHSHSPSNRSLDFNATPATSRLDVTGTGDVDITALFDSIFQRTSHQAKQHNKQTTATNTSPNVDRGTITSPKNSAAQSPFTLAPNASTPYSGNSLFLPLNFDKHNAYSIRASNSGFSSAMNTTSFANKAAPAQDIPGTSNQTSFGMDLSRWNHSLLLPPAQPVSPYDVVGPSGSNAKNSGDTWRPKFHPLLPSSS